MPGSKLFLNRMILEEVRRDLKYICARTIRLWSEKKCLYCVSIFRSFSLQFFLSCGDTYSCLGFHLKSFIASSAAEPLFAYLFLSQLLPGRGPTNLQNLPLCSTAGMCRQWCSEVNCSFHPSSKRSFSVRWTTAKPVSFNSFYSLCYCVRFLCIVVFLILRRWSDVIEQVEEPHPF